MIELSELLARYEARGDEGDYTAAKAQFARAIAEAEDARVLSDFGYLLESHARNELRQAVAQYERAIELDPDDDKPHYQLIGARAGLREPELAIEFYEPRLAASPRSLREHRFLSQAYLAAHAYAEALAIVEAGLALAAADAALIASRGEAKAGLGDVEGAQRASGRPRPAWAECPPQRDRDDRRERDDRGAKHDSAERPPRVDPRADA